MIFNVLARMVGLAIILLMAVSWSYEKDTLLGPNGKDGNISWHIANDTLIISGKGAMPDYNYSRSSVSWIVRPPWLSYRNTFTAVVIENSITSIGNLAFYECTGLTSVIIGNSVHTIEITLLPVAIL